MLTLKELTQAYFEELVDSAPDPSKLTEKDLKKLEKKARKMAKAELEEKRNTKIKTIRAEFIGLSPFNLSEDIRAIRVRLQNGEIKEFLGYRRPISELAYLIKRGDKVKIKFWSNKIGEWTIQKDENV